MIPRYYIVAEREHEIQNPTSEEKLCCSASDSGLASNPYDPDADIRSRADGTS